MKTGIWTSDWLTGLVITLLLLAFANSRFIGSLERNAYDYAVRSSTRTATSNIAIIAIDDQSIENIGRWPWPRDIQAKMLDRLKQGGAKVVAETVFFSEPQIDPGLQYIHQLKQVFEQSSISRIPAWMNTLNTRIKQNLQRLRHKKDPQTRLASRQIIRALKESPNSHQLAIDIKTFRKQVNSAEMALDTDKTLATSIRKAGNVILNMPFIPGMAYGKPDSEFADYITRNQIPPANIINTTATNPDGATPLTAVKALPPIPQIGQSANAIGASVNLADIDGAIRTEPLIIDYYGHYYPSIALLIAAKSLNLGVDNIKVTVGKEVQLGRLSIYTDKYSQMHSFFYQSSKNRSVFSVDSFYDVLQGKIPVEKYHNKIVLIGATALGVGETFVTPVNPTMPAIASLAHAVSSILNEDFYIEPAWGIYVRTGIVLLLALYLMFVLPRLGAATGFIISLLLLSGLLISEYLLMTRQGLWLQLMMPALLLITGHILLTTKRYLLTEKGKARLDIESAESNRMLGLALQGQGQLDMAFEKFRKLPREKSVLEIFYNLALDYERQRQYNKARSVYDYIGDINPKFRDIKARSSRAQSLEQTIILHGSNNTGGTLNLDNNGIEKPMLGRYEIERELGKGAMGAVYLGKDPKISRTVAIKTMALSQKFDADKLDDVKARFFREAKTAGRLTHPDIVTIYDAGEEQDLAYIAMEFLQGDNLSQYIKPKTLLPVEQVLTLIKRCALGLDYAHRHNVVHRDIKPANVMWDKTSDSLKITDFGIARITDSSKTKTGLVLGSPAYMSPEQIAGKKVSGQSDLFSLGVMLFQMVLGQLPFQADSMATLMYQISNKPHPNPATINPTLPPCISIIINHALAKELKNRYTCGKQMAIDINRCLKIMAVEKKHRQA